MCCWCSAENDDLRKTLGQVTWFAYLLKCLEVKHNCLMFNSCSPNISNFTSGCKGDKKVILTMSGTLKVHFGQC